jgi:hypothetical protein
MESDALRRSRTDAGQALERVDQLIEGRTEFHDLASAWRAGRRDGSRARRRRRIARKALRTAA